MFSSNFNPGKRLFYLVPLGLVLAFLPYGIFFLTLDSLYPYFSPTEGNTLMTLFLLISLYVPPLSYQNLIYIYPNKKKEKMTVLIIIEVLYIAMAALMFCYLIGALTGGVMTVFFWIFSGFMSLLLILLPYQIDLAVTIKKAQD